MPVLETNPEADKNPWTARIYLRQAIDIALAQQNPVGFCLSAPPGTACASRCALYGGRQPL